MIAYAFKCHGVSDRYNTYMAGWNFPLDYGAQRNDVVTYCEGKEMSAMHVLNVEYIHLD